VPTRTTIPENIADYPESNMFGPDLPAYGFWMRHAERISFDDVTITTLKPDVRPQFVSDDDTGGVLLNGSPLSESK
jgi:hypothetical protein